MQEKEAENQTNKTMKQKILQIFITCKTVFEDYSTMMYNARYDAAHGKELKILTPQKML